jgi:hypothetical protein
MTQKRLSDRFLTHQGVSIYHIFKYDDIRQGPITYHFTTDKENGSYFGDSPFTFDVRDLNVPSKVKLTYHPPFVNTPEYINSGTEKKAQIDVAWKDWLSQGQNKAIAVIIGEAIEAGLIATPGVNKIASTPGM